MYKVVYSETSRDQIRSLHPSIKPLVKSRIKELTDDPYVGKPLQRELAGYYSFGAKRFRIIYKISNPNKTLQIYHIGHRKDIYELLKEILKTAPPS